MQSTEVQEWSHAGPAAAALFHLGIRELFLGNGFKEITPKPPSSRMLYSWHIPLQPVIVPGVMAR